MPVFDAPERAANISPKTCALSSTLDHFCRFKEKMMVKAAFFRTSI